MLALVTGLVTAQDALPRELVAMADAERAFAKTATVKGWRDAFLEFFADDAVALGREVTLAKEGLRKQPSPPFSEFELVWEPRLGDVAASADLGWLTGPSTSINHTAKDPKPGHGCYLSVWRKQPTARGASSSTSVPVRPSRFRLRPASPACRSTTDTSATRAEAVKEAAGKSLAEADRDLNAEMAAQGASRAFASRVTPSSRLHRPGSTPIVGAKAIAAWLNAHASAAAARDGVAEAAAAGDFGYTYGTFEIKAPKPLSGAYLRLWNRAAAGHWWLMVDVAQPFRP